MQYFCWKSSTGQDIYLVLYEVRCLFTKFNFLDARFRFNFFTRNVSLIWIDYLEILLTIWYFATNRIITLSAWDWPVSHKHKRVHMLGIILWHFLRSLFNIECHFRHRMCKIGEVSDEDIVVDWSCFLLPQRSYCIFQLRSVGHIVTLLHVYFHI